MPERAERRRALMVTAAVVVAVAWPGVVRVVAGDAADSFPLSTYPMFAADRGRVVEVATVVGLDDGGEVVRLDPVAIAGTDQPVLAATTVRRAVAAGADAAGRLCDEVAARVDDVARVEVVVERHDVIAFAAGAETPLDRIVVAGCAGDGDR